MHLQKVDSIYDIQFDEHIKYGDLYHRNEVEWSHYNLKKPTADDFYVISRIMKKKLKS